MKLSELIAFRNQLNAMSSKPIKLDADHALDQITYLVGTQEVVLGASVQELNNTHHDISQAFNNFENVLDKLKAQVNVLINKTEQPWFQESYRLYEQDMVNETAEYILNRKLNISADTIEFYKVRLSKHTNWHYPAMVIRPGVDPYIHEILACDPLYIVDESYELLVPTLEQFNEHYQRRLRPYVINERKDKDILNKLPNEQFGLVFAFNYFNFKPFELIKQYLAEIYNKLKPGGMLIMTINDCDRENGVLLVEQHFCCYTPGYLVLELAQSLGFEISFTWTDGGSSMWIEIRKPGELDSLRGGQTLAKPVAKSK